VPRARRGRGIPKVGNQGYVHIGRAREHHESDLKSTPDRACQCYAARIGTRGTDQIGELKVGRGTVDGNDCRRTGEVIYVADLFAYRTVDGATGEVSDLARMSAAGGTLEYPMSATTKGNEVILSSRFTGTVQMVDRLSGKTIETLHDFKAPQDAIRLDDGSLLVNEYGTKSLVRVTGEHGKERKVVVDDLAGPVGLVGGANGEVYVTEALAGQVDRIEKDGQKKVIAKDLKMPEGLARTRDGKLIVAEVGAKRLVRIDPETGNVTEIAADLPIGLAGAGGLPTGIPTGVGVGAADTIYFSSDVENAIYKITTK
jgi:sugar lactone lactonase YvrE